MSNEYNHEHIQVPDSQRAGRLYQADMPFPCSIALCGYQENGGREGHILQEASRQKGDTI
jgi:hypothetical protein